MRKPATKITIGCVGRMTGLPGWSFGHRPSDAAPLCPEMRQAACGLLSSQA